MSLETGTYISDLNTSNPASGDAKSQGDDHIRLEKSALKNTFPNITGAVTVTHTQLNTAGTNVLTSGTATATTSGTSIDFTSIPSWVKKITISLNGVSTNGSSVPMIQIGDSGGIETASYVSSATFNISTGVVGTTISNGFAITGQWAAASTAYGIATLALIDSATNLWAFSCAGGYGNTSASFTGGGTKALSATLDRVRLTAVNGTDTFDAGSVNILYE